MEGGGEELGVDVVRPCMLNDREAAEVKVLGNDGKGAGLMAGLVEGVWCVSWWRDVLRRGNLWGVRQ